MILLRTAAPRWVRSLGNPRLGSFGSTAFLRNSSSSSGSGLARELGDPSKTVRQAAILASLAGLRDNGKLSEATEVSTNPYELDRHGRGESHHRGYTLNGTANDTANDTANETNDPLTPDVIVRPQTVKDVSELLGFCNEHRIPVIPYGAGTSVEGHVCATTRGSISLDMAGFTEVVLPGELDSETETESSSEVSLPDPIARVGAGVSRKTLNEALRATGMQFVVDPGADATIGGMVATGASGTTTVRYGTMRENLLGLECVLADGTIVSRIGGRVLKSSAGYDLVGLMCGSEGTLGVITSVTVKLHPIPDHVVAAVCVFESLADAANTVAMLKFCEVPMVRCELLDATSVAAFNASNSNGNSGNSRPMEEKATLFLEFQASSEEALKEQIATTQEICTGDEFGGSDFRFTSGEEERKALWAARHNLYYASINYRKGSTTAFLTDACVPLSEFASVLDETVRDVEETGVVGPCFGHAGDGNFHCILPVSEDEPDEYMEKVFAVHERIIRRALAAGGTCTGEHGVGYGKIKYLGDQYGEGAVRMMERVKASLDPNNILNPGKVVEFRYASMYGGFGGKGSTTCFAQSHISLHPCQDICGGLSSNRAIVGIKATPVKRENLEFRLQGRDVVSILLVEHGWKISLDDRLSEVETGNVVHLVVDSGGCACHGGRLIDAERQAPLFRRDLGNDGQPVTQGRSGRVHGGKTRVHGRSNSIGSKGEGRFQVHGPDEFHQIFGHPVGFRREFPGVNQPHHLLGTRHSNMPFHHKADESNNLKRPGVDAGQTNLSRNEIVGTPKGIHAGVHFETLRVELLDCGGLVKRRVFSRHCLGNVLEGHLVVPGGRPMVPAGRCISSPACNLGLDNVSQLVPKLGITGKERSGAHAIHPVGRVVLFLDKLIVIGSYDRIGHCIFLQDGCRFPTQGIILRHQREDRGVDTHGVAAVRGAILVCNGWALVEPEVGKGAELPSHGVFVRWH
ncbi:unnamed protein product [Pseudo-nitzschia multistriata]|uniref:D-lactate dehydrogenase (cytochrome) n=1 Tax=Pseudo-nitzschia multistriata TaxID=183589 RepID=A0A448ZPH5_9STRA|nr:unnamed protein product [Pseudo-nitzschia multistriata]